MPTSTIVGKAVSAIVMGGVQRAEPIPHIIDIGPGLGSYRRLMGPLLPNTSWIAVEIWGPYVVAHELSRLYDKVHIADFTCFDFRCVPQGGMAIMGDVLEHIEKDRALETIGRMMEQVDYTLLSIPVGPWPQGGVYGNPWEEHVHSWLAEEIQSSFAPWLAGVISHPFAGEQALAVVFLGRTAAGRALLAENVARAQMIYDARKSRLAYCGMEFCPDYREEKVVQQFHKVLGACEAEFTPAAL